MSISQFISIIMYILIGSVSHQWTCLLLGRSYSLQPLVAGLSGRCSVLCSSPHTALLCHLFLLCSWSCAIAVKAESRYGWGSFEFVFLNPAPLPAMPLEMLVRGLGSDSAALSGQVSCR